MLSAAILSLGCAEGDGEAARPLSDSVYVEVMARLVVLDSALAPRSESAGGDVAADSLRDRVLDTWGVDADRLLEYARSRGSDPERMEAVWRRVHELSDSLDAAGWTPDRPAADGDGRPAERDTGPAPDTAAAPDTVAAPDTAAAAEDGRGGDGER